MMARQTVTSRLLSTWRPRPTPAEAGIWLTTTSSTAPSVVLAEIRQIDGDGSIVRRNQVSYVYNEGTYPNKAYGIYTTWSVDITDNVITGVQIKNGSTGSSYGIYTSNNTSGNINHNTISDLEPLLYGHAYGIYNVTSDRITMRDNTVIGNGTAGGIGLNCTNANGRAVHNVITGFATGLHFCADGGTNDVTPRTACPRLLSSRTANERCPCAPLRSCCSFCSPWPDGQAAHSPPRATTTARGRSARFPQ